MMKKTLLTIIVLASLTGNVFASSDTESSNNSLKFATAVFTIGAVMDNVSTNMVLKTGGSHEENPLLQWAHDDPDKVLTAAVITDAVTVYVARKLNKNHHRLATTALIGIGVARMYFGTHNFLLYREIRQEQQNQPVYGWPASFKYKMN